MWPSLGSQQKAREKRQRKNSHTVRRIEKEDIDNPRVEMRALYSFMKAHDAKFTSLFCIKIT